jgi:hypothetical protein
MFKAFDEYFIKHATHPSFRLLLRDAITCYLDDTPLNSSAYPSEFRTLIQKQAHIGWHQLILGQFVTEWSTLQTEYLQTLQARQFSSALGHTWVAGIITIIWKHLYLNWEERNTTKHGKDSTEHELSLLHQAQRRTEQLYNLRHQVLPRDRIKFYSTITEHFEREPTSIGLRQWLSTWRPVILASIAQNKRLGLGNTRDISTYFARRS